MAPHEADNSKRRATTLAFHSLSDRLTFGSTNFSPRRFQILLERLRDSHLLSDSGSLELTFDDGYAHLADVLPGIAQQFSLRPIVFVPTRFIGQTNSWDYGGRFRRMRHLNAAEIQALEKTGVRFGSHSHSHCDLTALNEHECFEELSRSKQLLLEITGTTITALSYPFGKQSSFVQEIAARCGYTDGYTMSFPASSDSPLTRGRIPVYFFDTVASVLAKVRGEGLRFGLEKCRTRFAQRLSAGTVLLQRLRRNWR